MKKILPLNILLFLWNFWPPFLGSGIKIQKVSKDFRNLQVILKKRPWTTNYVGTQFGGSIFSMADPFFMVMLLRVLGPGYIVWDKSSQIKFIKPGKTKLTANFEVTDEDLDKIHQGLKSNPTYLLDKMVSILDANGVLVAEIQKVLYIKKK